MVAATSVHALPQADSPYYKLYLELAADIGHDLIEFDDLPHDSSERQKLSQSWSAFLKKPTQELPDHLKESPMAAVWTPGFTTRNEGISASTRTIAVPELKGGSHSIRSLEEYLEQRMGP